MLEPTAAHQRYMQQAAWTAPARRHLLAAAGLPNARGVLEVGCGTGAVLGTITAPAGAVIVGLDIDRAALPLARQHAPDAALTAGDAHALPYPDACFDIAFCHFVLLWVAEPAKTLAEMRRVVRPGGAVLVLAEPDYTQRIDEPAELAALGQAQTEALSARGTDPAVGGRLPALFAAAGLQVVDAGPLQTSCPSASTAAEEASMLRADLSGHVPAEQLERWLAQDAAAWAAGTRKLQVPTYYALGRVS
ncbi:MAG: methyltransferase domain-containing protein [Anaerolineales bacterium]|nr:MAG: methyltransferase domain-containing protein [Anaerolineales bacterium]